MMSLMFGLVAALCWGIHDVCVRFAAGRAGVPLALTAVLGIGLLAVGTAALFLGDWQAVGPRMLTSSILSGMAYACAGFGLYRAFSIGPVRLVSPIVGAFPVLSLLAAAFQGRPPSALQWLAVAVIVLGVAAIAIMSQHDDHSPEAPGPASGRGQAIAWALASAFGFALTFALGQEASRSGDEWPAIALARLAALLTILAFVVLRRTSLPWQRAPWGLLIVMGLCDAAALALVQAAGTLPHAEFAAVAASTFGVVTILLAWLFLRERMGPGQWAAVAVVFAGIGYLAL